MVLRKPYFRSFRLHELLLPQDSVLELYDLDKDPNETTNIALQRYEIVLRLKNFALNNYRFTFVIFFIKITSIF